MSIYPPRFALSIAQFNITFTIDGTSYSAESGMTWAEWVASEYNVGGYYLSGNNVVKKASGFGTDYVRKDGQNVSKDDAIISGQQYTIHNPTYIVV